MPKGCLITIAVIAGLIVVGALLSYIFCDEIQQFTMNKMIDSIAVEIKNNLPDGVTEYDVDNTITDLKNAINDHKIDSEERQELIALMQAVFDDQKINKEEAARLLDAVKEAISE